VPEEVGVRDFVRDHSLDVRCVVVDQDEPLSSLDEAGRKALPIPGTAEGEERALVDSELEDIVRETAWGTDERSMRSPVVAEIPGQIRLASRVLALVHLTNAS
jgi:hypothetical protein